MKRTEIKILSLIVSAIFSAVIVPAGLSAQEGGVEGLHTNKNSTYDNSTHQGKITLETFVEGEVKVKTQSEPCDIVMVLDFSASMASRIEDLKASCLAFLSAMRENNPEHRVAIVSYNKCEFTRIGWSSNEDGTVVWPQNPKMSSLSGYDRYGDTASGNKIKRDKNPHSTQPLYDHVKNLNWFIPLNDELPDEGNVAEYIVNNFEATDCGDDGNSYRGLQVANELLFTKRTNTDNNGTPRPTFVVLFTDGAPGFEPKSGETLNFSDEYLSICYAINAIGEANQLKSKNTTIFTVGINKNCNPEYDGNITDKYSYTPPYYYLNPAEGAFNAYLSLLSSNFIGDPIHTASDIDKGTSKEIGGKSMDYDDIIDARLLIWNRRKSSDSAKFNFDVQHYLGATQSSGMEAAFAKISEKIIEELPSMPLSSETVLKDYINKAFFKLPKDATVNDIVVYTRPFSGMSGSDFVFGTVKTPLTVLDRPLEESEIGSCVRVIIDWAEDGVDNSQDCVSVTGFDYAANWVGLDVNKNPHGCELVVEIPFVFKDGVELDGDLDTNTGDSGIYTPDNPDEPVEPYPVPTLSFKDLTITRSDLESGESAIYNVYSVNQGNKLVYTVVLTGTSADGSNSASKTITGVLARDSEGNYYGYKVTESDWDWAYNKDADNNSKTSTFEGSSQLEFEFAGAHKDKKNTTDPAYKQSHTEVKKSDRISKTN